MATDIKTTTITIDETFFPLDKGELDLTQFESVTLDDQKIDRVQYRKTPDLELRITNFKGFSTQHKFSDIKLIAHKSVEIEIPVPVTPDPVITPDIVTPVNSNEALLLSSLLDTIKEACKRNLQVSNDPNWDKVAKTIDQAQTLILDITTTPNSNGNNGNGKQPKAKTPKQPKPPSEEKEDDSQLMSSEKATYWFNNVATTIKIRQEVDQRKADGEKNISYKGLTDERLPLKGSDNTYSTAVAVVVMALPVERQKAVMQALKAGFISSRQVQQITGVDADKRKVNYLADCVKKHKASLTQ